MSVPADPRRGRSNLVWIGGVAAGLVAGGLVAYGFVVAIAPVALTGQR